MPVAGLAARIACTATLQRPDRPRMVLQHAISQLYTTTCRKQGLPFFPLVEIGSSSFKLDDRDPRVQQRTARASLGRRKWAQRTPLARWPSPSTSTRGISPPTSRSPSSRKSGIAHLVSMIERSERGERRETSTSAPLATRDLRVRRCGLSWILSHLCGCLM